MKVTKKTRRQFSREFKIEAIRQLELRGSRPVKDVAEALGVAESMLHAWRRELGGEAEAMMAARGESKDQELERLRRENQQLKQDADTLKSQSPCS